MKNEISNSEKLTKRLNRYASVERLMLMRNLGYGGAAISLAIIVGMAQLGADAIPVKVSTIAASIGLPLWVAIGVIYEFYIFLGKQSYPHLKTNFSTNFIGSVFFIAGLSLLVTIDGVIWYLMPEAAWIFLGVFFCTLIILSVYHSTLARWWYSESRPDESERK